MLRCPDDVMHDAVKEELRKIGKSRKNQDRRIRVHGNYGIAIGGGYKYPPCSSLCTAKGLLERGGGSRERK